MDWHTIEFLLLLFVISMSAGKIVSAIAKETAKQTGNLNQGFYDLKTYLADREWASASDTTLDQIRDSLWELQAANRKHEDLLDRIAKLLTDINKNMEEIQSDTAWIRSVHDEIQMFHSDYEINSHSPPIDDDSPPRK